MAAAAPASSPAQGLLGLLRRPWPDRRAELLLGAVACTVLAFVAGMAVFVFTNAWPSFSANGLSWFGAPPAGATTDSQLSDILQSPADEAKWRYELNAWPLLWGTLLTTAGAIVVGTVFATFAALFLVEFAPARVRAVLGPVVTLLAGVPSVVYGLIGILAIAPQVAKLISQERKESVAGIISLTGEGWLVGVLILTLMIVPIMVAIIAEALRQVPHAWKEGAVACGVNRFRMAWTIMVRTARPAIVAAAVLATARALGEAIMLAMVTGSVAFAPQPIDGITFLFEPTRPLAATVVAYSEGLSVTPFAQTIYAFAALLLLSAMALSLIGWAAKQPMRKYGIRA